MGVEAVAKLWVKGGAKSVTVLSYGITFKVSRGLRFANLPDVAACLRINGLVFEEVRGEFACRIQSSLPAFPD